MKFEIGKIYQYEDIIYKVIDLEYYKGELVTIYYLPIMMGTKHSHKIVYYNRRFNIRSFWGINSILL